MFEPMLGHLPAPQRELWPELGVFSRFVLYGGTAIALRFGHRQSVDFDFFTDDVFAPRDLMTAVPLLQGARVAMASPNTLVCDVDRGAPVKLSFFGGLAMNRAVDPDRAGEGGVLVASPLDLAATKLKAIWDRAAFKDYFDIDTLLANGIDLPRALSAARAIYGASFNPLISLKALCYFGEGDLDRLSPAMKERLVQAAQRVDVSRLPAVSSREGLLP